jgi:hypothetical protein
MSEDQTTGSATGDETAEDNAAQNMNRRGALNKLAVGGAVAVGALGGAGAVAATGSGGWKRETVVFDVACLGDTWRDSLVNYAEDDSDFRGMPFAVEGWIYPAGHIPAGDGFVPTQDGSIGRWLCRGSTLVHAQRPEPHVQTSQEFIFGPMTPDHLFAADNISSSGTEGTFETKQVAHRAIIGGTGRYFGVTGAQRQEGTGFNTSIFADGTGSAPNFQMEMEMLLPDL